MRVDEAGATPIEVAFCPGFARGLSLGRRHAVFTVSRPRDERFAGLPLEDELARRKQQPWCGVVICDLVTGAIIGWIRLAGPVRELFDVVALPGVRCPTALGPGTKELAVNIRPAIHS